MKARPSRTLAWSLSGSVAAVLLLLQACVPSDQAAVPTTPSSPVVPPVGAATGAFAQCGDCHEDLDQVPAGEPAQLLTFTHSSHFDEEVTECAWCHPTVSHEGKQVNAPTMGRCFTCHLGEQRPGTCTLCHAEAHPDRGDCSTCHGLRSWESHFTHSPDLNHQHAREPCESCHTQATDRNVGPPNGCPECHEAPHPTTVGSLDLEGCADCHTITRWTPTGFDHPPSGCIQCHGDHHDDPQRAQCQLCHSQSTWAGAEHSPTLAGAHRQVDCGRCHTLATSTSMGYPAGCVDCHHPPHGTSLPRLDLRRCYECHTTSRWQPPTFHHPASGCIDCHGNHHQDAQAAQCQLCHSQSTWAGAEHPESNCTSCHDRGELHSGLSSRCQNCHVPGEYWVPSTYDHPQVGEHIPEGTPPLKCFKCHTSTYAEASCKCHDHDD